MRIKPRSVEPVDIIYHELNNYTPEQTEWMDIARIANSRTSGIYSDNLQIHNNMLYDKIFTMDSLGLVFVHNQSDQMYTKSKGVYITKEYFVHQSQMVDFQKFLLAINDEDSKGLKIIKKVHANHAFERDPVDSSYAYQNFYCNFPQTASFILIYFIPEETLRIHREVFVKEFNLLISLNDITNMSMNPVYAEKNHVKLFDLVFADNVEKDTDNGESRISYSFFTVSNDHFPDTYFFYVGNKEHKTRILKSKKYKEDGIVIRKHFFNHNNKETHNEEEFIPLKEAEKNGFFRTRKDLIEKQNREEQARQFAIEQDAKAKEIALIRTNIETIKATNLEKEHQIKIMELEYKELDNQNKILQQKMEHDSFLYRKEIEETKVRVELYKVELEKLKTENQFLIERNNRIHTERKHQLDMIKLDRETDKIEKSIFQDMVSHNLSIHKHEMEYRKSFNDLSIHQMKTESELSKIEQNIQASYLQHQVDIFNTVSNVHKSILDRNLYKKKIALAHATNEQKELNQQRSNIVESLGFIKSVSKVFF